MLNKQRQGSEGREKKRVDSGMVHSILHQKYSKQPRLNYEYRKFEEYVRPIDEGGERTGLQLQCLEFLSTFNEKEFITTYHTLHDIFASISSTILNRITPNHPSPAFFHQPYIYHALRKYNLSAPTPNSPTFPPHIIPQYRQSCQIQKQPSISEQSGSPPPLPTESIPISSYPEELEESSLTVLQRINRELSIMLRKLSQNKLEANLTAYLTQIKEVNSPRRLLPSSHSKSGKSESRVKVKREPVLSKRKLENSTTRWQKIEEETETYGLNRIKRKKGSNEKKKKITIMSQTETIRKKIKEKDSIPRQSPQTPKPEYVNHCLSIHQFNIGSHRDFSLGNKKKISKKRVSLQKLKEKPQRPLINNQSKKKLKSKSKSKEKKRVRDHKTKDTKQEKQKKGKKTKNFLKK